GGAAARAGAGGAGSGGGGAGTNSRRASSKIGSALIGLRQGIVAYPTLARRHKKRFKTDSIQSITRIYHVGRVKKNSDRTEARPEPAGRLRGFGGHSPAQAQPCGEKAVPARAGVFARRW